MADYRVTDDRDRGSISLPLVAGLVVLALIVGGGVGFLVTRPGRAGSSTRQGSPSSSTSSTTPPSTAAALRVVKVTPTTGSTKVNPALPISITFSSAVASNSARPRLSPSTPGTWNVQGNVMSFVPSVSYLPLTPVTMTVPSGSAGVRSNNGGSLAKPVVVHFRTENGSVLRLQQLLSELDYSPLSWQPAGAPLPAGDEAAQTKALVSPPAGSFTWRNHGWPVQLLAKWKPGVYGIFTRGLVMSFEADHGLVPKGTIDQALWQSLLVALANHAVNTGGYNYALANKTQPESLTIWHNGHVVIRSPANTGIASSPTPDGNFNVYSRLRQQVMKGTNPNGSKYADLVQYIAYFNGNDAVHYMPRPDYGIPQSLGCIELPFSDAAKVWPYLAYGTIVTVIN
ncbi:MAG: L,D-transpeptidase family protein [Acidimicrobiales bacterium]